MRTAVAAAITLALIAAIPRPVAACSKRHQTLFELYERAASVAIVKVRAVPGPGPHHMPGAGEVQLGVVESLKGVAAKELIAKETNTSCHAGFRRGRRALVFLGADGWPAGAYEGYVEDLALWAPLVRRFAAATSPADRLAVVLDTIESSDRQIAQDGAYYLVDHPELLVLVDAAATDRLVKAAPTAWIDSFLPAVLVRTGDLTDAAALLTRQRWTRAKMIQRLVDHRRFESIDDPAALATTIEDAATDDGDRIAALERCERVRGAALFPFTIYDHGVARQLWPQLADACRTGMQITR